MFYFLILVSASKSPYRSGSSTSRRLLIAARHFVAYSGRLTVAPYFNTNTSHFVLVRGTAGNEKAADGTLSRSAVVQFYFSLRPPYKEK